ncbi:MAG: glycosyltransferase [Gemmatimonadaceae bacterium]
MVSAGRDATLKVFLAGTSFSITYGGPAYSVSRLANALAEAGVMVGLWAPDASAPANAFLASQSSVRRLAGSLVEAMEVFGHPDLIHDNGLWLKHNHDIARLAARRAIPRLVSTRGMLEPWALRHKRFRKRLALIAYQRRDLQNASMLHATSEREASHLGDLELHPPICVIPNGVDIPPSIRENGADGGERVALFLGRIYPIKGLLMLIEAWSRVRPPGWRLHIAGPDEAGHLAELKAAVGHASLDDVVSFPGTVTGSPKAALLRRADLFVLPSHSESFGMAVAEALASGLPVLTTTSVPWPQLPAAGAGWRVSPTVEGITSGLRVATRIDTQQLRAMGRKGRDLVGEAYRWPSIADNFIDVYHRVKSQDFIPPRV